MVEVIDLSSLPLCLQQLEENLKQQINDTLINDDVSSDDEIVGFWVSDCGIPKAAADAAIQYRDQVLSSMDFLHLFAPIV